MESKRKIKPALFILHPDAPDGCTWYRIKQFTDYLKDIEYGYFDPAMSEKRLLSAISVADGYLIRLSPLVSDLYETILRSEKPIILDIDDRYDEVDPLSDSYQYFGTQEVVLKDGTKLWEDGVNIDIKANRKRQKIFKKILSTVDLIITTTVNLHRYASKFNKNVVIIPNAIDFDLFPRIEVKKPRDVIRIVWSGGSSHYNDLFMIKDVLKEIMKKYPKVEYHHVGQEFKGILKDLPQDRVFTYRWLHPHGHGYRLATIGGDIGLCPLNDTSFNRMKSSIKYYEYSAVGMATIAKNIPPYSDDIKDGYNALLYSDEADLYKKIEFLINDPIKRIELANNAYDYVKKHRNIIDVVKDWEEVVYTLLTKYGNKSKIN